MEQIGQPAPTGPAASLVGPSGSATSTGNVKTTPAATTGGSKSSITSAVVKTTTKNGIASIFTSLIADATGKSDSNRIRPISHDVGHIGTLSFTAALGSLFGFALVVARLV